MTRQTGIIAVSALLSIAYWGVVLLLVLAYALDCVQGSQEYPCPTPAQLARHVTLTLAIGGALYGLAFVVALRLFSGGAKAVDPGLSGPVGG